jgi:hypothetical protein
MIAFIRLCCKKEQDGSVDKAARKQLYYTWVVTFILMLCLIAANVIILYSMISGISDADWPTDKRYCNLKQSGFR